MKPLYEIHITCMTSQAQAATEVAKKLHWKTSEIARDPVLGNDTYFYLTKYAETLDIAHTYLTDAIVALLYTYNVEVIREKIEHIVHDVRYK
jgi:hypothetical protein